VASDSSQETRQAPPPVRPNPQPVAAPSDVFQDHEHRLLVSGLSGKLAHNLSGPLLFLRYIAAQGHLQEEARVAAREEASRLESLLVGLRAARVRFEDPTEVLLAPVARCALSRVAAVRDSKLQVAVAVASDLAVSCDELALELLLVTLLRRAALASPAAGALCISASRAGAAVEVRIESDSREPSAGIGIDNAMTVAGYYRWTVTPVEAAGKTIFRIRIPGGV
jgi:signal transduction histidine kinase